MKKRWRVADPCPSDFALAIGQSSALAQLFWNRGLKTRKEVEAFLHPSWDTGIHDPQMFSHSSSAVARVFKALETSERITVHGDYDADGVTGSTILITVLRELEQKIAGASLSASSIDFYIPHREKEGYGLHTGTVSALRERGTGLIITVDCGIACPVEIAEAKQQGMDVIVIDHHEFGEVLPDGFLIHPRLPEETYPFKFLAAVGVSYKFACALLTEARRRNISIPEGWEKWLLDLVAIATVTDMVPLIGENRVLETYGLRVLNKTRRPGLLALLEQAKLSPGSLTTESIGFGIGPRLNAAGRMDHASLALNLLLTESIDEARLLAIELEQCNRDRQESTKRMMAQAEEKIMKYGEAELPPVLALWDRDWSPSLVGLVAGRFVEKTGRPVIAIGQHAGTWIGSGRSIKEYNITEAMRAAGEGILTRVGGHPQACGFALVDEAALPRLEKNLIAHAASIDSDDLRPSMEIEAEIPLSCVNPEFESAVACLEPFGEGNRQPTFVSRQCSVVAMDVMGSTGAHLRLTLLDERGRRIKAVGFKLADRISEIQVGSSVDIVYHVMKNVWNGQTSIECRLIDFALCIV